MLNLRALRLAAVAALVALGFCAGPALSGDCYWAGEPGVPGDWWARENWDLGMPATDGNNAFITNGGTALFDGGDAALGWLIVESTVGGHESRLIQTGGTITSPREALCVGRSGGGVYELRDGLLTMHNVQISDYDRGWGSFIQSGGYHQNDWINVWQSGSYELSGTGTLQTKWLYVGSSRGNRGTFRQEGGTVNVTTGDKRLLIASADAVNPGGLYVLIDGVVNAGSLELGYFGGRGEVEQSGGEMNVEQLLLMPLCRYVHASGGLSVAGEFWWNGELVAGVGPGGAESIDVRTIASLTGRLTVEDLGAPLGRFALLTAADGVPAGFSAVTLPGADWRWGIQDGTIWAEKVPEPAALGVLALGGLAVLRRRRGRGRR